jgi:hypothetical protein
MVDDVDHVEGGVGAATILDGAREAAEREADISSGLPVASLARQRGVKVRRSPLEDYRIAESSVFDRRFFRV